MPFAPRIRIVAPQAAVDRAWNHTEILRAIIRAFVFLYDVAIVIEDEDLPSVPFVLEGLRELLAFVAEAVALDGAAHQKGTLDRGYPYVGFPRCLGDAGVGRLRSLQVIGYDRPALARRALGFYEERLPNISPAKAKRAVPVFYRFRYRIPCLGAKEKLGFLCRGKLAEVVALLITLYYSGRLVCHDKSYKGPLGYLGGLVRLHAI